MVAIDICGQKFGRLTAVQRLPVTNGQKAKWRCLCDCGQEKVVQSGHLRNGLTASCGCLRRETTAAKNETHGLSWKVPEWAVWYGMIRRCTDPRRKEYPIYGGRGIKVCDRWRGDFAAFLADVGPRPSPKHSIDRYPDNNGNYEPGNCRWATSSQQAFNRRPKGSA